MNKVSPHVIHSNRREKAVVEVMQIIEGIFRYQKEGEPD